MSEQLPLIPEAAPSTEKKIARRVLEHARQLGHADALQNHHRTHSNRVGTSEEAWAAYDAGWDAGHLERAARERAAAGDDREVERAFRSGFHTGFEGRENCREEWATPRGWVVWFRGWQQGKKAAGRPLRAEILAQAERKPAGQSGSAQSGSNGRRRAIARAV